MTTSLQVFTGMTAKDDAEFFHTDDDGKRFAVVDFVWSDGESDYQWDLLFIPLTFYEQRKSLFRPNRLLCVRGELDAEKPIIYVKDAYVRPQFKVA